MIRLELDQTSMLSLYFDDIEGGRSTFIPSSGKMTATVTQEEFDRFLKANNLIPYHHQLKGYEDGTLYGEFSLS